MTELAWKNDWLPVAQRFASRTAVTDEKGSQTYRELFDRVGGVASFMVERGLEAGDTVAVLLPNGRDVVAASLGVAVAGLAEAGVNPALSDEEVRHCLKISGARLVITAADRLEWVMSLGLDAVDISTLGAFPLADVPLRRVSEDAPSRITFTSGTTGKPKGIVLDQAGRWAHQTLIRSSLPVATVPGEAVLLMTPFCHGASLLAYAYLQGGAEIFLYPGIKPDLVRSAMSTGRVRQIFAPPTVLSKLVGIFSGQVIEGVNCIYCGTAPLSPELYASARAVFGPVVRVTYGKSEIFNPITVLTPEETEQWINGPRQQGAACVGWPASGVEVRIGTDDVELEQGEVGPVLLRARHMLSATLTESGRVPHGPDEFHHTGDLGFIDKMGRLNLVGREADVMKTGGYKVTPEEVEGYLRPALPGADIVVLGIPSPHWGEVITAVGANVPDGWEELLASSLETMTQYKRPRLFAILPELPRNGQGKVVRSRVRDAVLASYEFVDGPRPALTLRPGATGR